MGYNPYTPCILLWKRGFVPSFDGTTWRLHSGKEAKIVFEDLHGDRVAYKEQGPWAFFRIMDNYELQSTKLNDHFIVDYVLEGKKAKFELIANSVKNPFSHSLLKRYRAPESLN